MKVFIVTSLIIATAFAAPSVVDNQIESDGTVSQLAKIVGHCADSGDLTGCLSIKGITMLNRAARSNKMELAPGIAFTRDSSAPVREGKALSENDIAASLPTDQTEKTGRLIDLAIESAMNFMNTHNLQFKLPSEATEEFARAFEEGRRGGGKLKKMMGPLLMAVAAKFFAIIPLLLGGLALLATKALVVAKIAFVLAAVLGAQKFLGGGSSFNALGKFAGGLTGGQGGQGGWGGNAGWSSGASNGWSSGSNGAYPYARSLDAQDLAYIAQAPTTQQ